MKRVIITIMALFILPSISMAAEAPAGWQREITSLVSHQRFEEAGDRIREYCVEQKSGELCLVMASAYLEGETRFGVDAKDVVEAYK
ncbi:MAG: hypothetical protein AB2629_20865, partial [Candidatus Thiodiazotropha sp.]